MSEETKNKLTRAIGILEGMSFLVEADLANALDFVADLIRETIKNEEENIDANE